MRLPPVMAWIGACASARKDILHPPLCDLEVETRFSAVCGGEVGQPVHSLNS